MPRNTGSEAEIRDYLAEHLDLIEPGLTLVRKEQYLPNDRGASGFVDIFARSSTGQLVVIEIKRSDAAAREAIQELFKYAALLRQAFLVKNTGYRLLVLSFEWHELLVPYSEFAKNTTYEVAAGRILLGPDGLPASIESVSPAAVAAPRNISRRHFIWHFVDEVAATKAIPSIAEHMRNAGLSDFVLVLIRLANPAVKEKAYLYFGQQQLRFDEYAALIRRQYSDEQMAEFEEALEDLTEEEDRVGEAADAVWVTRCDDLYNRIGADSCEIAHPEKAQRWFEEGAYTKIEIHRFGRFEDQTILDTDIIADLVGLGGESDYRVDLTARVASKPQVDALIAAAENVFFFNPVWRGAVRDLCSYARKTGAETLHLQAFSTDDILMGVAGMAFGCPLFMSAFRFEIDGPGGLERFVGMMEWDGTPPDFDAIVKEHLDGDRFNYLMLRHFGENRSLNGDIMADLGLRFTLWREADDSSERVRVQGASIVPLPKPKARSIIEFIEANHEQVDKIVAMFLDHDQGFAQTVDRFLNASFRHAEENLAGMKDQAEAPDELYWTQTLESCDLCGRSFASTRFMVDAHLKQDIGANVCALCFFEHGTGLGAGRGQLYEATDKGWCHVAG